jgi:hypothetical protein
VHSQSLTACPINKVGGIELALHHYTRLHPAFAFPSLRSGNTPDFDLDATTSVVNIVVDLLKTRKRIRTCSNRAVVEYVQNIERRCKLAPDLITPPVSTSTHYAHTATGRVVSALSAHRAVLLRLTGAIFPPLRVSLQQRRQPQHQQTLTTDVIRVYRAHVNTGVRDPGAGYWCLARCLGFWHEQDRGHCGQQ